MASRSEDGGATWSEPVAIAPLLWRLDYYGIDMSTTQEMVAHGRTVEGLGLLPVETTFGRPKVVRRSRGKVVGTDIPVEGRPEELWPS